MKRTKLILALAMALAGAPGQAAQLQPASDLLLPWFEVDLDPAGATTLFAVGNALDRPVDVLATVSTNWGIPILQVPFPLQPGEIRTVNLRDWLRNGAPGRKAATALELEHLAAAASGRPSPRDNLYYSSEVLPGRAVGSVTLRTRGSRPDALWGDWFVVEAGGGPARGGVLADIDSSSGRSTLCRRHLLRYLGGGFDGGTELVVWREVAGRPSASPGGSRAHLGTYVAALSEPGLHVEDRELSLLPLDRVAVAGLGLPEAFGSLRIETADETFIGVRHSAGSRYDVAFQAHCLAPSCAEKETALSLEVLLEGKPVPAPPGILVESGTEIDWILLVANTGQSPMEGIQIEGLAATCPRTGLGAGEVMVCTAVSTALSNQQAVEVKATGRSDCAGASALAVAYYQGALVDVGTFP